MRPPVTMKNLSVIVFAISADFETLSTKPEATFESVSEGDVDVLRPSFCHCRMMASDSSTDNGWVVCDIEVGDENELSTS